VALRNLLERDWLFTERLREETSRLQLPVVDVDVTITEDDLTGRITELFELGIAPELVLWPSWN
jgi:hypothetical protein